MLKFLSGATIIVDELKEGFNIMLHPKSATQKKRKIGEALLFYYKISIVPLLMCFHLAISLGTVTRIWPLPNCIALLLSLPATLCVRFVSSVCAIAFAMKSKIELNK